MKGTLSRCTGGALFVLMQHPEAQRISFRAITGLVILNMSFSAFDPLATSVLRDFRLASELTGNR
jgi:hypothetical protein